MRTLTLEALVVVDAIDRKGSFAAAAASLYKVPSKVSYTIKKLEQDIGVPLFVKEGRQSKLTPAGRHLLEQGRDILLAANRLVESTRQVGLGWTSSLNIAVDSLLDFSILSPVLKQLYQIQPNIDINLFEEVLGGAWEAVIDGRVDLTIGAPEPPDKTTGLHIEKIQEVEWLFAVAPEHPLTKVNTVLTNEDIKEYRAVVVRDSSRQLPPFTRRVFERQPRLVVSNMTQKIQAQLANEGVGFLPRFRIKTQLASKTLIELKTKQPDRTSVMHMAWKKGNKDKALHWLIEKLKDSDFQWTG